MSPGGLHILIVDPLFRLPATAGPSRSYDLARLLIAAGHRVTVVAAAMTATMHDLAAGSGDVPGIDLRVFDDGAEPARFGTASHPGRLDHGARFAARQARGLLDLDAALIAHPASGLAKGVIAVCRHREVPFILDERTGAMDGGGIWSAFRFRYTRRGAYAALAASPDIRGWLAARLGERMPILISPAGADTDRFTRPSPLPAVLSAHPRLMQGALVVFAGSLSPTRPFGRLLDMVAAMRRQAPDVTFVICGDGPIRLDLNAHAARLDVLERNLWFAPALARHELPGLLAAATVVLAFGTEPETPLSEPGNHLYDGLAAGKPVAVFGGGWQRDLIESRQAGIALPTDDGATAARDLADFLREADLVRRAGEQAVALAHGRINTRRIHGEIRALLERAAAEQPRAAVIRRKRLERKRRFDIAFALLVLVGLAPVWLVLMLVVAVISRRWPIEGDECVGFKGRKFRRYRFTAALDHFLSRTGLGIGPTLLNVVGGSMSLVGPAPHPFSYAQFYNALQQRRLDMRPGLTSHSSTTATDWDTRFSDDLWYVDNVAMALDLKLMAGALWRTLTGRRRRPDPAIAGYDEVMARSQGAEDA